MTPPDVDEVGLWAKAAGAATALLATCFGAFKMTHGRIANVERNKADRDQVENHHKAIIDLYSKHEKVSDRLVEMERCQHKRHVELLNAIHAQSRKAHTGDDHANHAA